MPDSCPREVDIPAYFDHIKGHMEKPELTDEQIAGIGAHISSCQKCTSLFQDLELFERIESEENPPAFSDEASQRIWRRVVASMSKMGLISEERAAEMIQYPPKAE